MSLEQLNWVLLAGALVLLAGVVGTRVARGVGLPSLLLFLALGVLLGEDGLGIDFDDAELARNLGTTALAVILVEGGLTTKWSDVRKLVAPAGILATVGIGVSLLVTAAGAHFLLGFDWQLALLLGAIVSSTDAAAVFSVLRVLPLPRRVAGLLEAESGFNDAPTVILVLLFSVTPLVFSPGHVVASLGYQLGLGVLLGLGIGFLGAVVLPRIALPASGLYPLASFGLGFVAFAASGAVHASGFIAAYLCGVVLANSGLPHRSATRSFAEGLAWLAQIGLFVLLGLLVTPTRLTVEIIPGLVIGLVLLLLARPLAVVLSLVWFRVPLREQAFLSWAGLRGAVPIVLATFPVVQGVPNSQRLLDIVFVLVMVFTVVQGPSLRPLARWLRILPREATREVQVEAAPLDVLDAELLSMSVPPDSAMHAVTVRELRLPEPGVVTLIIRDRRTFVPSPETGIETGDELFIVTTVAQRQATENRLRAVSRRGRLAHWFGERGDPA
ncbi:potassium/proton antiporter [Saccharopolyspora sp. NPDC049357]|uniref:potassium/proton antiporter n=1 Tax=Saccharopolyspora sp. NPDC049357 TaxID=3154507 RepID=UPI0034205A1A